MGSPLISDAQMRRMHSCLSALREQQSSARDQALHATIAALSILLAESDALVSGPRGSRLQELLAEVVAEEAPASLNGPEPADALALFACGVAVRQRWEAGPDFASAVTVALLNDEALDRHTWQAIAAQSAPLILLSFPNPNAADQTGPGATKKRAGIPSIPVDGSDAVAVCRVLQESLLRARGGLGSVAIQAFRLSASRSALVQVEEHLRRRGAFPSQ